MLLILVFASLAALANAQCQAAYAGICSPGAVEPCCNTDWICLRHTTSQCGSSNPVVEQHRCVVAGGFAPFTAGIVAPDNTQDDDRVDEEVIRTTTVEDPPVATIAPVITVETLTDIPFSDAPPCALECVTSSTMIVSPSGPSALLSSNLATASRECGALSLSQESFGCANAGDSIQVTVTAASGHACIVPVTVEASRPALRCKPDARFELSEVNDYIFQRNDVVDVAPVCGEELNVLHSPVMLVCSDAPSRSVNVFYGNTQISCNVTVTGPQCAK